MNFPVKPIQIFLMVMALIAPLSLSSCSGREEIAAKDFVGKWTSSRSATPVYLYANGEWEIKADGGAVMQYGVWQVKEQKIIWSYRQGSQLLHDPNTVLSVTSKEFQVREQDGSTTMFTRLESGGGS